MKKRKALFCGVIFLILVISTVSVKANISLPKLKQIIIDKTTQSTQDNKDSQGSQDNRDTQDKNNQDNQDTQDKNNQDNQDTQDENNRDTQEAQSNQQQGTRASWKCLFRTNAPVGTVKVSPDNQMILCIENQGYARVYDYNTLATKTVIKLPISELKTGAFYPDGKSIALGTVNGIAVYSLDGKLLKKCAIPTKNLAFSPSGHYIVAKNAETVSIVDANNLKVLYTIKPFPYAYDVEEYHFAFLKDDFLVYLSKEGRPVFYSLKDGKAVDRPQPALHGKGYLIAISDDQKLLFVNSDQKGQVFKMDDGSLLCQIEEFYADQVIFKHNSHDLFCFTSNRLQNGNNGEISIYNAENGRLLGQFRDDDIQINTFTTDQSGKRLLIAGNGLFIMGDSSEPEIKLQDLGYRPMFVVRKTTVSTSISANQRGAEFPVSPNMMVNVSNNEELHKAGYYWCKAQVAVDGASKEVSGYISKDYVSSKRTTTIDDLKAYKKVLQGSYQFKDFATLMKSPASYPNCFGEYSGELVGDQIEIHTSDNGKGIPYLDISDYGQRFFVEIPSQEFADDWNAMKGGGWSEGDKITLYLKFSHIGTFTNGLGMVFRIPVFRALALYDEYRVIYLKK